MDIFTFAVLSLAWSRAYYCYFKRKERLAAEQPASTDREHPAFLDPILKYTELIISLAAIPCMAAMLAKSYESYPTLVSLYTAICVLGCLVHEEIIEGAKSILKGYPDDE